MFQPINSDLGGVYNIGTITVNAANTTTFDVTKVPNYNTLTNANFIVQINSGTNASKSTTEGVNWTAGGSKAFTISKNFNPSTGKLTVAGFPQGSFTICIGSTTEYKQYPNISVTAYAMTGTIK